MGILARVKPKTMVIALPTMGTNAKVYIWMNDDQSSVQLTFTNNTVSAKAQSNLK